MSERKPKPDDERKPEPEPDYIPIEKTERYQHWLGYKASREGNDEHSRRDLELRLLKARAEQAESKAREPDDPKDRILQARAEIAEIKARADEHKLLGTEREYRAKIDELEEQLVEQGVLARVFDPVTNLFMAGVGIALAIMLGTIALFVAIFILSVGTTPLGLGLIVLVVGYRYYRARADKILAVYRAQAQARAKAKEQG